MATIKKGGKPAAKVPASKAPAKKLVLVRSKKAATLKPVPGTKVIQATADVALYFNLVKLGKERQQRLIDFAEGLGLFVAGIRDGSPKPPPPPPPAPSKTGKRDAPARKTPAKKPPQP